MDLDLVVSVVTMNHREEIRDCLATVLEASRGLSVEVCVLDNASRDGTSRVVRRSYPDVRLFRNRRSRGFARNHNRVIQETRSSFVLVLNPDTLVGPGTLRSMLEFMKSHPRCGVSACPAFTSTGENLRNARTFPTPLTILARRSPIRLAVFDRIADEHLLVAGGGADWLSGAFLFIRRDALDEVGLFDESYILYFEDVDLCRRMGERGWQVLMNRETRFIHDASRASRRWLSRQGRLHIRSMLRYFRGPGRGHSDRRSFITLPRKPLPP